MDTIIEALVTGASDETILEMIAEKGKEEQVHQNEEENKEEVEQPKYRSCIKIRGRPILPPVMTEEVRLECQEWKRRALEVEERLALERRTNIMEKVDRIVTRALATGHKVEDEVQIDESLRLESGELSEEESAREDVAVLNSHSEIEDGDNEDSAVNVMRANSRLGEEVLTGRTIEENIIDENSQKLSEGEVTEEVTDEIFDDTDEEEISEEILGDKENESETKKNEALPEVTPNEKSESDQGLLKLSEHEYNTEVFVESDKEKESFLKPEEEHGIHTFRSQISEPVSGPKSFEEIKKLVKSLPVTPTLPTPPLEDDKMTTNSEDDASSYISDDENDETCAPSITTEVYEEWKYNLVGQKVQELNRRPGITDSLLSVTTVVENPTFEKRAAIKEKGELKSKDHMEKVQEINSTSTECVAKESIKERDEENQPRQRRGSYSVDKPSPLLAAHMARFGPVGGNTIAIQDGGPKEDSKVEGKDAVESLTTADLDSSTKKSASNVSQRKGSSTPNDEKQNKRELLQRYLESLASQPPCSPKPSSPARQSPNNQLPNRSEQSSPIRLNRPSSTNNTVMTSVSTRQGKSSLNKQSKPSRSKESPSLTSTSQASDKAASSSRKLQASQSVALTPQKQISKNLRNTPVSLSSLSGATSYQTPVPSPFTASRKLSRSPNPQTPDFSLSAPKGPANNPLNRNQAVPGLDLDGLLGEEDSSTSMAPTSSVTLPTSSSTYRASTRNSEDKRQPQERYQVDSQRIPEPEDLQQAVSSLALAQQASLQHLLARQEEERKALRQEFEARQRELVAEILQQFPGLNLSTTDHGKENMPPVARNLEDSFSKPASQISNQSASPLSRASSSSVTLQDDPPIKSVMRSNTFKINKAKNEGPPPVQLPSAALAPLHLEAWTRLTALARGFLTRRLMRTERIGDLKRTIRETLSCAVQLHHEAGGAPNKQELDLHARLLAQLEAACADVHHIFFGLTVGERMALLANDRAARQARAQRRQDSGDLGAPPRLSSATAARIAAKSKPQSAALASFESRRRRAVLSSRTSGLRTSPRNRLVRSIYSAPGPRRNSSMMTKSTSSLKPSWK